METPSLETVVHGASVLLGVASALLLNFHRGNYHANEDGVNVSDGDGFSSKIIKKFPKYAKISPAMDHVLQGVAATLGTGGVIGLTDPGSMAGYYVGGSAVAAKEAIIFFAHDLRRKIDTGDLGQYAADMGSIALTLYAVHQLIH